MSDDIYDESQETFEDPYADEDYTEVMPELREEETSKKPILRILGMPEQKSKVSLPKRSISSRARLEDTMLRYDTLRKKKQ